MARNQIDTVGPDFHKEVAISFKLQNDGNYRKVLTHARRDRKTNTVKELDTEETDEFYEVTQDEKHDEKIKYTDLEGKACFLKLKLINNDI